ncbi:MAG: GIY-YIG nuclease family protein [Candidatus Eisenbacteria bacterium]|nr:GIY-YIG nuclease family protein [Candidatus Eisenbacteria bacterium]
MPYVYLLRCCDGSFYAGSAKDLQARLRQHEAGRASRYTRGRLPVAMVWSEQVATWSDALRAEHRVKRMRRAEKERLVGQGTRSVEELLVAAGDRRTPGVARVRSPKKGDRHA